jgi:hypothetical protein
MISEELAQDHHDDPIAEEKQWAHVIIMPVLIHLIGGPAAHMDALKPQARGPSLAVYVYKDPTDPHTQRIFDAVLRCTLLSLMAPHATGLLMGLRMIFAAPLGGNKAPHTVNVHCLPRDLPRQPLYWVKLRGLPDWCTPAHLSLIMQEAFGLDKQHGAFYCLDRFNDTQTDTALRQLPSMILVLHNAEQVRITVKSRPLICTTLGALHVQQEEVDATTLPFHPRHLDIAQMPNATIKPPTIRTETLCYSPLSLERLNSLMRTISLPDRQEQGLEPKRLFNSDLISTPLPQHRIDRAIEVLLHQHLHEDKPEPITPAALRSLLTRLQSAVGASPTNGRILSDWFVGHLHGDAGLPWFNEIVPQVLGPYFRVVDTREEADSEQQSADMLDVSTN